MIAYCPTCKTRRLHLYAGFDQLQCDCCGRFRKAAGAAEQAPKMERKRRTFRLLNVGDHLRKDDAAWVTSVETGKSWWRKVPKKFWGMSLPPGSPPVRREYVGDLCQ